jgi:hypothetical protein
LIGELIITFSVVFFISITILSLVTQMVNCGNDIQCTCENGLDCNCENLGGVIKNDLKIYFFWILNIVAAL